MGSLFIIFFYKFFMITFAGFAFAGDHGMSKIDVSTDGGKAWKSAIIKDPLSKYTYGFYGPVDLPLK